MKPRIIELNQTCTACPSQWEGKTEDGRYVYIRYRGGYLSAGIGASLDDAVDDRDTFSLVVASADPLDGYMDEATMRSHVGQVFDFNPKERE